MTAPQLRKLALRITGGDRIAGERDLVTEDLISLGYGRPDAERILQLLSDEAQLDWYIQRGAAAGCIPVTRVGADYPPQVRKRLGLDSPGCLWAKGDRSLLQRPMIALVGSRELKPENRAFACEVGKQAALQGYVLVSGNARGADQVTQAACLEHGGQVISVVADRLDSHREKNNVLYLSEDGYDCDFSAQRALSRNRVIHCLAPAVFVAQCTFGKGGTWDGTLRNLQGNWSAVFCLDDGSAAVTELCQRGAQCVSLSQLSDLAARKPDQTLFDQ